MHVWDGRELGEDWGGELHVTVAPGPSFSHRSLKTQRSGVYRKYQTSEKNEGRNISISCLDFSQRQPGNVMLANMEPTLSSIVYNRAGLEREIS